jgi:HSP20 family protein
MNIIPWRRRELHPVKFPDDLLSRFFRNGDLDLASRLPEVFQAGGAPAVNIGESEDRFRISMDCPGMNEADFKVEALGNSLVISGERRFEDEQDYWRVESQFGRFQRSVELPPNARTRPDDISAVYKRGVLTIDVRKVEKTPAAKIPVQAG